MERLVRDIANKLQKELPKRWDGKNCIQYMKDFGSPNWRQMEWFGFFFEFIAGNILSDANLMRIPGISYGNVQFDGFNKIPWDFKAHASNKGGLVPTNGFQETTAAINDYGSVGFIVASGTPEYDTDGSFKQWHDSIKGGTSNYEFARIARGASSRQRKVSFELDTIEFVLLDEESLEYVGKFQKGMINSDGKPRNSKVMLNLNDPRMNIMRFKF